MVTNTQEYNKRYYQEHKEEAREYGRKYYREHRERICKRERERRQKNREKYNKHCRERQRRIYGELRERVIELLGGKCVKCGFSDVRAFQIDHVEGGGCV